MGDEEMEGQNDAQKQYLMAKINDLTDGIGPGYSEALMEELVSRLERTVALFHEEVSGLMESLKAQALERDKKLKTLLENGEGVIEVEKVEEEEPITSAEIEMSEWEMRLEERAAKGESASKSEKKEVLKEKEEPKRRLFGRKKK